MSDFTHKENSEIIDELIKAMVHVRNVYKISEDKQAKIRSGGIEYIAVRDKTSVELEKRLVDVKIELKKIEFEIEKFKADII